MKAEIVSCCGSNPEHNLSAKIGLPFFEHIPTEVDMFSNSGSFLIQKDLFVCLIECLKKAKNNVFIAH